MLRGHKQYCPYQSCSCEKCRFTAEQQRQMRLQNAIRRAEAQDRGPNSTSGGSGSGRRQRNSSSSAAAALQHQHQQNQQQQQQQQQLQQIVVSASSSQPEPQRNGTGTPPGKHITFNSNKYYSYFFNFLFFIPLFFIHYSFLEIYIKSKKKPVLFCFILFYFYYKFYSSFLFLIFIYFFIFYFIFYFLFSYPSRKIQKKNCIINININIYILYVCMYVFCVSPTEDKKLLFDCSSELLKKFRYPWEMMPIMYALSKYANGNIEEVVRKIEEGTAIGKFFPFYYETMKTKQKCTKFIYIFFR